MDEAKNQITDRHKVFGALLEALRQGPVEIGDLLMALRQVHADRGYLLEQVAVLQKSDTALRDRLVEDETAFRSEISDMEDRAAEAEIELERRHQNALAAAGKAAQERDAAQAELERFRTRHNDSLRWHKQERDDALAALRGLVDAVEGGVAYSRDTLLGDAMRTGWEVLEGPTEREPPSAQAELAQLRARVAELEKDADLVRAHGLGQRGQGQRDTLERVAGWLECEPTMAAVEAQIKASAEDLSAAVLAAEQLRQRAAPAMPLDRAKQIGDDLVRVWMESMGVPGGPIDVKRLRSYTLGEQLEAMRVLSEAEKREEAEAKAAAQDGRYSHTVYTKVADRGIAAIYALLHHEACDPREVEPIISVGGAALAAIVMPPPQDDDADEEENAHG